MNWLNTSRSWFILIDCSTAPPSLGRFYSLPIQLLRRGTSPPGSVEPVNLMAAWLRIESRLAPRYQQDGSRETAVTALAERNGPSRPLEAHSRLIEDLTFERSCSRIYGDRCAGKLRGRIWLSTLLRMGRRCESFLLAPRALDQKRGQAVIPS